MRFLDFKGLKFYHELLMKKLGDIALEISNRLHVVESAHDTTKSKLLVSGLSDGVIHFTPDSKQIYFNGEIYNNPESAAELQIANMFTQDVTPLQVMDDEIWYSTASGKPISSIYNTSLNGGVQGFYNADFNMFKVKFKKPVTQLLSGNSGIFNAYTKTTSTTSGYECKDIVRVVLPSTLTSLPEYGLKGCSKLESITLPQGLKEIGRHSLAYTALTSIKLPEGLESINNRAFMECRKLTRITIPDSVTKIEQAAFTECTRLTHVSFGKNLKTFGIHNEVPIFGSFTPLQSVYWNVVDLDGNKSAYWSDSVDVPFCIENRKISDDTITEFKFGPDVQVIPARICYKNNVLTELLIPSSVSSIHEKAFYGCSALETVTFGHNVLELAQYAFSKCTSLRKVVLPKHLESIGTYAFQGCSSLEIVVVPCLNIPHRVSETAFYNNSSSGRYFYVPDEMVEEYKAATNWSAYKSRIKPISELKED